MFKSIVTYVILSLYFMVHNIYAQTPTAPTTSIEQDFITSNVGTYMPPSPTVASLFKFSDVPVNYSTGMANASIPLYTMKYREFVMPLGLSYQSNGLKVEEIGSWTGMGWSLNAGGVISRTVVGAPDKLDGSNDFAIALDKPLPTYEDIITGSIYDAGNDFATLKKTEICNTIYNILHPYYAKGQIKFMGVDCNDLTSFQVDNIILTLQRINEEDPIKKSSNDLTSIPRVIGLLIELLNGNTNNFFSNSIERDIQILQRISEGLSLVNPPSKAEFISAANLQQVLQGKMDLEHDVFNFSCGNYSGKFIVNVDHAGKVTAIPTPFQKIKIDYMKTDQWMITTPDGMKYIYGLRSQGTTGAVEITKSKNINLRNGVTSSSETQPYSSAWHLVEAYLPDGTKAAALDYTTTTEVNTSNRESEYELLDANIYSYNCFTMGVLHGLRGTCAAPPMFITLTENTTHTQKLSKITTPTEEVSFFSSNSRSDYLSNNVKGIRLDSLQIKSFLNVGFKQCYRMQYDFSQGRMLLKQVNAIAGNVSLNHSFDYYPGTFPARTSKAQDWWGFYNGKTQNAVLYPNLSTEQIEQVAEIKYLYKDKTYAAFKTGGADRKVDTTAGSDLVKIGMLKRITYPTGGFSEIVYEANTYSHVNRSPVKEDLVYQSDVAYIDYMPTEPTKRTKEQPFTIDHKSGIVKISASINWYTLPVESFNQYSAIEIYKREDLSTPIWFFNNDPRYFNNSAYAPPVEIFSIGSTISYKMEPQAKEVHVQDNSGNPYVYMFLPPGNYMLKLTSYDGFWVHSTISYNKRLNSYDSLQAQQIITEKRAGGVRVKSVSEFDKGNVLLKSRSFKYQLNATQSSGEISHVPYYIKVNTTAALFDNSNDCHNFSFHTYPCTNVQRTAGSICDNQIGNSHIYYSKVEISTCAGDTCGKTIQYFSAFKNSSLHIKTLQPPYIPSTRATLTLGDLVATDLYNKDGEKVRTEINYYDILDDSVTSPNRRIITDFKAQYSTTPSSAGEIAPQTAAELLPNSMYEFYYHWSVWKYLSSKLVIDYFGSRKVETLFNYFYDDSTHAQLTREEIYTGTIKSDGTAGFNALTTAYTYPSSASSGTEMAMYKNMQLTSPLAVTKKTNDLVTEASRMSYKLVGSSYRIDQVMKADNVTTPIAENNLHFIVDGIFDNYDADGNVVEMHRPGGEYTCLLWGYGGTRVVAKITGERWSTVKALLDANTISQTTIRTPPANLTMQAELNKLRTALPNALIETYVYHPVYGPVIITDVNSMSSIYEYDSMGRLVCIRDHDNRILKQVSYHLAN